MARSCSAEDKMIGDEYGTINKSPSPKLRRVSLKSKGTSQFSSPKQKDEILKGTEVNFGSENDSPPLKVRRTSFTNLVKVKSKYSNQENSCFGGGPASGRLVAACRELANLAVSRGSLDDITVMIIDLSFFKD